MRVYSRSTFSAVRAATPERFKGSMNRSGSFMPKIPPGNSWPVKCTAHSTARPSWPALVRGGSSSMPGVSGASFTMQGLFHSPRRRPRADVTRSDFDAQTRDANYLAWRKADSFEDALLIMALKGEKSLLPEIKNPLPDSMSSVTTDLDHLSISSLSASEDGTSDFVTAIASVVTSSS